MPAAISKAYFDSIKNNIKCNDVLHPWSESCFRGFIYILKHTTIGSMKFFTPIYLVQLMLDYKLLNKEYIKKWLKKYYYSCCYLITLGTSMVVYTCITSKLIGFQFYNLGLGGGFFGATSIFFETEKNVMLTALVFFNWVLESIKNNLEYWDVMQFTTRKETVMFMLASSCLMYLLKNRKESIKFSHFWFYVPDRIKEPKKHEKPCSHEENKCVQFIKKGVSRYFAIGYSINMVKYFLSRFSTLRSPKGILNLLVNKDNFRFGICTAAYAGIFRVVSCYLAKLDRGERPGHPAVAGLLAGLVYTIKPDQQLLIVATSTLMQVALSQSKLVSKIPPGFPTYQLVFMVSNALLFHVLMMVTMTAPKNFFKLMNIASNGLAEEIIASATDRFLN